MQHLATQRQQNEVLGIAQGLVITVFGKVPQDGGPASNLKGTSSDKLKKCTVARPMNGLWGEIAEKVMRGCWLLFPHASQGQWCRVPCSQCWREETLRGHYRWAVINWRASSWGCSGRMDATRGQRFAWALLHCYIPSIWNRAQHEVNTKDFWVSE